jgi:uncharacterized membrane protein YbhN (UPF0104 family)
MPEMQANKPSGKLSWARMLRWAGSLASVGLFIWLLARQDWARVWEHLQRVPIWLIGLVFALYVCGQLFNALRWYLLLRAQQVGISLGDTIRIIFSGAFASNFLPTTIGGDAFRFVALFKFTDNRAVCMGSVLLDRLMNVTAMITMMPLAVVTFGSPLKLLLGGRMDAQPAAQMVAPAGLWAWLQRTWSKFFTGFKDAFRLWARQPGVLAVVFVVSWLSIFVVMVGVWILARGLGIPVALYQVMGVMATTYLLTLLPISINGYGVREVAITTLYMHLGGTLEQASALALITRIFMVLETVPGALWMARFLPGQTIPAEEKISV